MPWRLPITRHTRADHTTTIRTSTVKNSNCEWMSCFLQTMVAFRTKLLFVFVWKKEKQKLRGRKAAYTHGRSFHACFDVCAKVCGVVLPTHNKKPTYASFFLCVLWHCTYNHVTTLTNGTVLTNVKQIDKHMNVSTAKAVRLFCCHELCAYLGGVSLLKVSTKYFPWCVFVCAMCMFAIRTVLDNVGAAGETMKI